MHRRKKTQEHSQGDCAAYIWKRKAGRKENRRFNRKRRMDSVNAPIYVSICRLNLPELQAAPIDRLA
jgi:hypothetical protein